MITILCAYEDYAVNSLPYKYLISKYNHVAIIKYKLHPTKKFNSKVDLVFIYLLSIPKILFNINSLHQVTYVLGLHFPFFIVAKFFKNINDNIIIDNFYIHGISKSKIFNLFLKWILNNKRYKFIVQSEFEKEYFEKISSSLNIEFVPYCMKKIDLEEKGELPAGIPLNYVFSGGYTNRDYDLVIEAAKSFPHLNFVLVVSNLNTISQIGISNLIIYKDINHALFTLLLYNSKCVIIPLKHKVGSSGQMLCLEALQFGKPIIYSLNSSINHYFNENYGIPYIQNDLLSLKKGIEKYLNLSENDIFKMSQIQFRVFEQSFTEESRSSKLIKMIDDLMLSKLIISK